MQTLTFMDKDGLLEKLVDNNSETLTDELDSLLSQYEKIVKEHGLLLDIDIENDKLSDKWFDKTNYFEFVEKFNNIICKKIYEYLTKEEE